MTTLSCPKGYDDGVEEDDDEEEEEEEEAEFAEA